MNGICPVKETIDWTPVIGLLTGLQALASSYWSATFYMDGFKGHHIHAKDVDGMKIIVNNVEIEREMADQIVKYVVRLSVEGEKVTVTCYDTTLSLFVQASQARLNEYCVQYSGRSLIN